jgi:hypothetical protein
LAENEHAVLCGEGEYIVGFLSPEETTVLDEKFLPGMEDWILFLDLEKDTFPVVRCTTSLPPPGISLIVG